MYSHAVFKKCAEPHAGAPSDNIHGEINRRIKHEVLLGNTDAEIVLKEFPERSDKKRREDAEYEKTALREQVPVHHQIREKAANGYKKAPRRMHENVQPREAPVPKEA